MPGSSQARGPEGPVSALAWYEGFMRTQQAREAAASVSLSHHEGCDCTACRATAGDLNALAAILDAELWNDEPA
jgi:hypothetical protein